MQEVFERLPQRGQGTSFMANNIKTALQYNVLYGHSAETASSQLIGERKARNNRQTNTRLDALLDRFRAAHFGRNPKGCWLQTVAFQSLLNHKA